MASLKKFSFEKAFEVPKIKKIIRSHDNVRIFMDTEGDYRDYDHVVLSCHADESLNLIENPTDDEKKILNTFTEIISNTRKVKTTVIPL